MKDYKTLQELFADESRWAKNMYAYTKNNIEVNYDDPKAVKWCLMGGIDKVYADEYRAGEIEEKIKKYTGKQVVQWNDDSMIRIEDIQALVSELDI